jgi:hypothetical protein
MSYNKAQFQVAFNPVDLIDNLKSAQIAALGRDRTIAQLNKMSNLDNPWAKLTAYSALGRFAQQYQHEKIEALGGSGASDMQKQYMRDVSSYLEQKTAHAKKEKDIMGRIKEADVYGVMSSAAGMENIEGEFEGGEGGGVYGIEYGAGEEEGELSQVMGSMLAEVQARSEFGLELEQGRTRFSSLLSQAREAMGSEAEQGSLSAAPLEEQEEVVAGGRRKKLSKEGRPRRMGMPEEMSDIRVRGMNLDPRQQRMEQSFRLRREYMQETGREPSETEMRMMRQEEAGVERRKKKLGAIRSRRAAGGIPSFEEAFEEQGGGFSYLDPEPSSFGGGEAIDYNQLVTDYIAGQGAPAKATQSQLEAWEEYLYRLVRSGQPPVSFSRFKKDFYRSEF